MYFLVTRNGTAVVTILSISLCEEPVKDAQREAKSLATQLADYWNKVACHDRLGNKFATFIGQVTMPNWSDPLCRSQSIVPFLPKIGLAYFFDH